MDTGDIVFTDQNPDFIEFKENVRRWLELDDNLRKLREATKKYNNMKKELTPQITDFMSRNEVSDINVNNGKLRCKTGTYKKPLSQKIMQQQLVNFFNNLEKGKQAAEYLLKNRETVERVTLTRRKDNAKKKNLEI